MGHERERAPRRGQGHWFQVSSDVGRAASAAERHWAAQSGLGPASPDGVLEPARSLTAAADGEPGGGCGRLLHLLAALALLSGATGPFAAAPAGNLRQEAAAPVASHVWHWAQGFTTGGNPAGYRLTGIELSAADAVSDAAKLAQIPVQLWSATDTKKPGRKLHDLATPSAFAAGAASIAAPANVTLAPDTTRAAPCGPSLMWRGRCAFRCAVRMAVQRDVSAEWICCGSGVGRFPLARWRDATVPPRSGLRDFVDDSGSRD